MHGKKQLIEAKFLRIEPFFRIRFLPELREIIQHASVYMHPMRLRAVRPDPVFHHEVCHSDVGDKIPVEILWLPRSGHDRICTEPADEKGLSDIPYAFCQKDRCKRKKLILMLDPFRRKDSVLHKERPSPELTLHIHDPFILLREKIQQLCACDRLLRVFPCANSRVCPMPFAQFFRLKKRFGIKKHTVQPLLIAQLCQFRQCVRCNHVIRVEKIDILAVRRFQTPVSSVSLHMVFRKMNDVNPSVFFRIRIQDLAAVIR